MYLHRFAPSDFRRASRIAGKVAVSQLANVRSSRIWHTSGISRPHLHCSRKSKRGVGQRFESPEGRATLSIYATDNEAGDTPGAYPVVTRISLSLRPLER